MRIPSTETAKAAKDFFENFKGIAEAAKTTATKATKTSGAIAYTRMAKTIIHASFLLIRQDFVGFVNIFELGLAASILANIGVIFTRQTAI